MSLEETVEIGELFDQLLEEGYEIEKHKDYDVISCKGLKIQTYGNKFVRLLKLSRHKTTKNLLKIHIESEVENRNYIPFAHQHYDNPPSTIFLKAVTVTTDHVCMIYDKDHFFENIDAKHLKVGDYVSIYVAESMRRKIDEEFVGTITKIEDLGQTDDYVYDCEVDDDMHSFYANDVLIHNSQFIDLQCVTEAIRKKYDLKGYFGQWPKKYIREVWNVVSKFVNEDVNSYVRNLVHDYCHTDEQNVLTYELEYMASQGIYESKKHYFTHKVIEEGDDVCKDKVVGIELKKNVLSKEMKRYLTEIYDGVINKCWSEKQFDDYITDLYNRFTKFSIDDIAFWKGYSTEREADGFLSMQVGSTGIATSCVFYNQIIEKMGLGKKYEQIRVGNKVRHLYVDPSNKYGIDQIAYLPDQWPKEFTGIFKPDYHTMFNKIILDPLKRFRAAAKFEDIDPSKQVVADVFDL